MKICVAVARYSLTGVPMTQIRFARALAARGHSVDLMFGYIDAQYTLPDMPELTIIDFGQRRARGMLRPLIRYLVTVKPDILFCSEDNLTGFALVAAIFSRTGTKISGSSHVPPWLTYSKRIGSKGWLFRQMMKRIMWRADALTCVSKDMVLEYHKFFPGSRHVAVYNVVADPDVRQAMAAPVEHPWYVERVSPLIMAAGTLSPRKGFTDLIAAMGLLRSRGSDARLVIFGEGRVRAELEAQVARAGLQDAISLPGRTQNMFRYFARSDVFALSSYAEGLPTVLVEAMMSGCSPVATDCPTGPREVLEGDHFGRLVPMHDPEALAAGIADLLEHPISATMLAEAVQPFQEASVIERHFAVLGINEWV